MDEYIGTTCLRLWHATAYAKLENKSRAIYPTSTSRLRRYSALFPHYRSNTSTSLSNIYLEHRTMRDSRTKGKLIRKATTRRKVHARLKQDPTEVILHTGSKFFKQWLENKNCCAVFSWSFIQRQSTAASRHRYRISMCKIRHCNSREPCWSKFYRILSSLFHRANIVGRNPTPRGT